MLTHVRPAFVVLTVFTVVTGVAYPLLVTGIAQLAAPYQANGSLLQKDGKTVGSALIGQQFVDSRYFHPRPSATSRPDPKDATKTTDVPYNAANSSGSNLGPTSKKLVDRVKADVDAIIAESGVAVIPADAVTTSASGLDPHISPAFAKLQAARVAKARNMPEDRVRGLISERTETPSFGFIGEPRVNVLQLNLALDGVPKT
ncbi:MAG: potassium-transporting ATPase subunit KdpC [Verrucomicrobiae bacterium]|nr:potassium-transporting ATPase subunit KdpC [Verrucomicrobiae bacterium]